MIEFEFGSNVGALACANIAPVLGSITITVPDLALEDATAWLIAFCATHCTSRSMVSRILVPDFASTLTCSDPGIIFPRPFAYIYLPLTPESKPFKLLSIPAAPVP